MHHKVNMDVEVPVLEYHGHASLPLQVCGCSIPLLQDGLQKKAEDPSETQTDKPLGDRIVRGDAK